MTPTPDIRTLIDEVRRTDIFGSPEFFSRTALVAAGCAVAWLWLDLEVIPYWFAAYYGAVLTEKMLLRQYPGAASRGFMAVLVGVSTLTAGIYVALPVYLWFRPEPVWHFAAMVMLVAGCLNIFQLRSRVRPIALAYFLPVGAGFVAIALGFWVPPDGGPAFWMALVLSLLIAGYFALSVFEAQKANDRMLRTQVQLMQSQKIEALESLVGGMSHDFRNLLSIVQGNLELLQEQPSGAERRACIRDALAAARSGTDLSTQLGRYARRISAPPARVDPIRVVAEVRRMARHVLPSAIRLQVETPSTMVRPLVDESALEAVLLNLIVRARDAIGGSGTITLETYVTETNHTGGLDAGAGRLQVVFEVGDTGADPNPDPRAAFEPGEPGPGGRGGLALATAHGFAEQAGGTCRIECIPGRGSRVLLQIPA